MSPTFPEGVEGFASWPADYSVKEQVFYSSTPEEEVWDMELDSEVDFGFFASIFVVINVRLTFPSHHYTRKLGEGAALN